MSQTQEETRQISLSINDLIYTQLKELGKRMDRLEHRQDKLEEKLETARQELNQRMDRIESRLDKQEAKIEETRKEINNRIDKLSDKIDSSNNHGQIATISTVGIALGVLYTLFFK